MGPKTFVLYHANCADGFGAAFAAWLKLGTEAVYIPVAYEKAMPEIEDGSDVYLVDFSYSRAELEALKARVRTLVVLDHHATAEAELADLPFAHFERQKCGAVMAWEYFHPNEPIPGLFRYVQDRDLWLWQLPDAREICAGLDLYPFEFELWRGLQLETLRAEGTIALRMQKQIVDRTARRAFWCELGGYRVPVANATAFGGEVANRLLELYPEAPFAAFYAEKDGLRSWGLRSRPTFDCSAIATSKGGGGHKTAAGFRERIQSSAPALA